MYFFRKVAGLGARDGVIDGEGHGYRRVCYMTNVLETPIEI